MTNKVIFCGLAVLAVLPTILLQQSSHALTFPEATSQPPTAMEQSFPQTQNPTNRTADIMQQLKDPKNIIPDKAVLLIYTDTDWSGSILDSSISSASQQGSSDTRLEFDCSSGGIYSLAFQKHSVEGYIILTVLQNGKILASKNTTAEYGVVTLSGHCD